jgi:hypothetical protein
MADTETPTETKPGGGKKGARATINVSDIPLGHEQAVDVLGAASGHRRGGRDAGEERGIAQKFARAIRDPNNKIIATRQQPPTLEDGTALGDTYEIPTHEALSEQEIKRDISEARGGRKWIIRVYDEDDKILASKSMDVPGAARLDPMMAGMGELGQENQDMEPQAELTEEELLEQTLARDPEIIKAQKKLRLKQIQNEEEEEEAKSSELRARRIAAERAIKGEGENGNGNGHKKHDDDKSELMKAIELSNAPLKEANAALQKRLDDSERRSSERESKEERRRELESMTKPLADAQAATQKMLEQFMTKMGAPPSGPTPSEILTKLEAMEARIKSDTKDQILVAINGVNTTFTAKVDGLQTLLTSMKGQKDDPAVTALISLATGGKGGAADKDAFSQVEKLLTVLAKVQDLKGAGEAQPPDFPSYLVEKVAETTPEVLNFFKEQRGAIPTKEEIEKMMRTAAMKMYEGLDASMKKELAQIRVNPNAPVQNIQQQPTPAPTSGPAPAPASVGPTSGPAPTPGVADFPGGPAAAAPTATPATAASTPPAGLITPDKLYASLGAADRAEYKKRIDWVLNGLLAEMRMGVREMKWPEKAHGNLPKSIIDQLVESQKDTDIYDIVKHYADQKIMDAIWEYLKPSHPQHEWYQGWLADGVNWIKQAEGVELVEPEDEGQPPVVED